MRRTPRSAAHPARSSASAPRGVSAANGTLASSHRDRGDAAVKHDKERRTKLIPDVSFYWPDRFKGLPREQQEEPPFSPEIAIEVRSRGDKQSYLNRKIERYFATGSQLVLDVDFRKRTIVAYTPDGNTERFGEQDRFTNERFPWFTFELRDLFSVLDPIPGWMISG